MYYHNPDRTLDRMAFSLTGDMGCEHGGGVSCTGDSAQGPKQSFIGYMLYNRMWFHKDLYGFTLGGGQINNPGRYLVLLPPINGATALREPHTLPRVQAIRSRPGTRRPPLTICRLSTSLFEWSMTTDTQMCPTSPVPAV